jgi:ribosome maturation factor RimP
MGARKEKLENQIKPLVEEENLELVELEFSPAGPASLLRVYVDKTGGVTVDQCAALSRKIGDFLDTEDLMPSRYTLQVSSPGLDRPLVLRSDFKRKIGERVKVLLKEGEEGSKELVGKIKELEGDCLHLVVEAPAAKTDEGEEKIIPLEKVVKAQILF